MRQMADHNFISRNDLKSDEYNYWIKKAADHGSPQAQYEAFTECISGNPPELLSYLMQADGQSYAPASLELGRLYACGDGEYGIVQDERKALELYQKAAALNHPEALYLLYLMEKLEIPSREEAERHPDAYARYLQQAQQQKAFPVMPPGMDGEDSRNRQSQGRIREMLKNYLPQNPKAVEWIQKTTGKRRCKPHSLFSGALSAGKGRLPDCRASRTSRTMSIICPADSSSFPSISSSTSAFISSSRCSGSSR